MTLHPVNQAMSKQQRISRNATWMQSVIGRSCHPADLTATEALLLVEALKQCLHDTDEVATRIILRKKLRFYQQQHIDVMTKGAGTL